MPPQKEESSLRKKIQKIILLSILLVLAAGLTTIFHHYCTKINKKYPQTILRTAQIGQPVYGVDGYSYTVDDWRWASVEDIRQVIPSYKVEYPDSKGNLVSEDCVRFLLVTITIKNKCATYDKSASVPTIQSGTMTNCSGFVSEFNEDCNLTLDRGQKKTIVVPYELNVFLFNKKEWENIESREFDIVCSLYPIKAIVPLK